MEHQRNTGRIKRRNSARGASPWDDASLLSKYSFYFLLPLMKKGYHNQLTLDDISEPPLVDYSHSLGFRLEQNYNLERLIDKPKGEEPSFVRALINTFAPQLLILFLFAVISKCMALPMQAISLGWLIRDTSDYLKIQQDWPHVGGNITNETLESALAEAYGRIVLDACLLMLFLLLGMVLPHPLFFQVYHVGMKVRIAACYMIYKKALRLSQSSVAGTTLGQMVNLLSNDVNRFDQIAPMLPYLVLAPVQALVVVTLLATVYIGPFPTFVCLATLLLYIVLQSVMGRAFSKLRATVAGRTDERVRLMNEIILAMRIIKMYSWELPFKKLVHDAREREMATIGIASVLKAINQTLYFISSKVIVFSALITYVLMGNTFSPEIVFVTISLADLIRLSMTLFFPNAIALSAETLISCHRINRFLMLPELDQSGSALQKTYKLNEENGSSEIAISMQDVYCTWAKSKGTSITPPIGIGQLELQDNSADIVRNLKLEIKRRDLVLIVGRVGSGKSSVIMAMLGELPVASGKLAIEGKISYASQEPWIFSGTVKENILFGKDYQAERYSRVLQVCSLQRDLEIMVDGDATVVGARGASLSGGQKARVNLARALYAEADIYILDDPLSAVDAPVARHIFKESIMGFLKEKTVILATHQLQFLRHASKVLIVDRKSPAAFGTLQEVMDSQAFKVIDYSREIFADATNVNKSDSQNGPAIKLATNNSQSENGQQVNSEKNEKNIKPISQARQQEEVLSPVSADLVTYVYYLFNATNLVMFNWFIFTNLAAQTLYQITDYFLSSWTDSVQRKKDGAQSEIVSWMDQLTNKQILTFYGFLLFACFISSLLRSATLFAGTYRASINIHYRLFESITNASMKFFDFSPIGILLNRLSRDMGFVDETLPAVAIDIITIFVNIAGSLVTVLIIDYKNLIASIVLIIVVGIARTVCATTIKRLKQIEGLNRSPMYSHLSTTLSGLPTIRVFGMQDNFMDQFNKQQDAHSSAWFNFICASRWLAITIEWFCFFFIGFVVLILLTVSFETTNASLIGLIISQVVVLPHRFQWAMRQLIDLESQMTSVQRIKELSDLEPEEGQLALAGSDQDLKKTRSIAQVGQVKFSKLTLHYFPDEPPVLKGISFTVEAGEKVGVVGRTGAGKSSIVSVLFRLYDYEGSVEIDGIDTKQVPLASLRSAIGIIPQEPVLFGATIRINLDPSGEHSDADLWAALEAVNLRSIVATCAGGLEFAIKEGGSNFSVGQRQLFCLARAIVRRNKILVLDEATASVDPETDQFIQKTIAKQFAHCTVITIAHRLNTIANSDRVLVLDRGEVKEFATPYELIQNESSLFRQMVDSSAQQAARIKEIIESEHRRRVGEHNKIIVDL